MVNLSLEDKACHFLSLMAYGLSRTLKLAVHGNEDRRDDHVRVDVGDLWPLCRVGRAQPGAAWLHSCTR